ncbi:S-adenosyl-L-methionine-dependent methyltransferase [Baffinella frigidus]|nr:S-adenosyl-L-methionine-dependent methyltransferase [Cryptophyta sp. CCMP2293]
MRFMSNLELEQTEVRLVIHPDGRAVADKDYLPYQCLQGMLLSLPLFPTRSAEEVAKEPMEILIVGLAGGMLPRYLRNTLPATNIDCVELDPAVADIAKEYFDLSADKGITVHVADGVDFVAAAPEDWYDLTLMDVNACDENDKILEAPPRPFITPEFINAWARTTRPGGVAAMNVLCSDPALFNTILLRIRDAFGGPVSFLKDHAEDADENYVVYVCKPVPGKPLEAPTSERVRAKLRLLEQQAPSLKQFNLSKRTAEQFNQFDPDAFP